MVEEISLKLEPVAQPEVSICPNLLKQRDLLDEDPAPTNQTNAKKRVQDIDKTTLKSTLSNSLPLVILSLSDSFSLLDFYCEMLSMDFLYSSTTLSSKVLTCTMLALSCSTWSNNFTSDVGSPTRPFWLAEPANVSACG